MIDDDIDESTIGMPSPEWWAEAVKDPAFKAFIDSHNNKEDNKDDHQ